MPPAVLDAFALVGRPVVLPGGEGRSVRVGDTVLKPVDDEEAATWAADLTVRTVEDGFRLPHPVRSRRGNWVVDGWAGFRWVPGEAGPAGHWDEVVTAGRAFHQALATEPRPSFLDRRRDRWAHADRAAWGEEEARPLPALAGLATRMQALRRPVRARPQLVHGDLAGNVLVSARLPPAVIDFSPYWRPATYADAVVAVDGLLWYGADDALLRRAWGGPEFPQMLVRALLFRLLAHDGPADDEAAARTEHARFARVAAVVERVVSAG